MARILRYHATKRDILKTYLSIAYFGYGLNGCDSAARLLFRKNAVDLDKEQAAFVASLLVYPLPKVVQERARLAGQLPTISVEAFLRQSDLKDSNWAFRASRRMRYAIHLDTTIEKSSQQVQCRKLIVVGERDHWRSIR